MAQKYIIGDLVKVWLDLEIKYQVAEVVGYNPTYQKYILTNWYIEETRGCISVAEDRIMPIPLTPEIIEKNGWKSINGKYALKIKNANYVVLEFTEDGIYTYINENTMLFSIKNIHELQHLLYALHIDSNLKI